MGASPGPGRELPATLPDCVRAFASHTSPRILATIVAAAVVARLALGGWSLVDLAIAAAIVAFWPLQEWLIHVCILHWRPREIAGRTLDFRTPKKHRAHHRDPWQLDLVFIPLHVYAYAPLLVGGLWWAIAPAPAQALSGVAVYFALSLHYEWVHFLVHTRYRPRSRHYERLWRNHRLHHFKNERFWYGVTMLSGDRLLGTAPAVDAVPTSPTARTLGLDEGLGTAG
jgi:hypothetical protein